MPFSRGTRMCLGHNLAWAELYIVLATVVRRCGDQERGGGMLLWETGPECVDLCREFMVPVTAKEVGGRGVRVLVV